MNEFFRYSWINPKVCPKGWINDEGVEESFPSGTRWRQIGDSYSLRPDRPHHANASGGPKVVIPSQGNHFLAGCTSSIKIP